MVNSTTGQEASAVWQVLQGIDDPEMPVSIVELGIIETVRLEENKAYISLLPTFTGCAALQTIRGDIQSAIERLGFEVVEVSWNLAARWQPELISEKGRLRLAEYGIVAGVAAGLQQAAAVVACPYCGSDRTSIQSFYGAALCRMSYYCDECRNVFEKLKCAGSRRPGGATEPRPGRVRLPSFSRSFQPGE